MARKGTEADKLADKRYDEKRAGQRTRNWTVILYPEDLPEDWVKRINDQCFKWVQSPLHDKDCNANGEPKKAHYHALFIFSVVKSVEQIKSLMIELFGQSGSGSIIGVAPPKQVNDRSALVRYMAHLDNPEKVQYDVAEIIGYNGADISEIMKRTSTELREMTIAMEIYIEDNEITELADFVKEIREDQPEWYTIVSTKMTLYFNAFIRSRRHKLRNINNIKIVKVNEYGEIIQ